MANISLRHSHGTDFQAGIQLQPGLITKTELRAAAADIDDENRAGSFRGIRQGAIERIRCLLPPFDDLNFKAEALTDALDKIAGVAGIAQGAGPAGIDLLASGGAYVLPKILQTIHGPFHCCL